MICFGDETDQELKEKGHVGPTFNKKIKKNIQISYVVLDRETGRMFYFFYIIFFFLLSLISSIYGNRTVRIRRGKKQMALLDEGYAWEQKTRDFTEFLIKIRKILCFGFSQIYGFLPVRIGRSRRSN